MSPLSLNNGWTDRNSNCCVKTVDQEVILRLKICELWSSDFAITTNFVARDSDKLAYPAFIVCGGILQRIGISRNAITALTSMMIPLQLIKIS